MSVSKLTKYINLALNNSSEGEAQTSARMFFKKLTSLDMKFNTRTFNLTRAQARRLADLAGKVFKGLNDAETLEAPASEAPKTKKARGPRETWEVGKNTILKSKREVCYYYFDLNYMDKKDHAQDCIDWIVETYGFDKRSVQSYASNYRAGKWR